MDESPRETTNRLTVRDRDRAITDTRSTMGYKEGSRRIGRVVVYNHPGRHYAQAVAYAQ